MKSIHDVCNITKLKATKDISLPHRFFYNITINTGTNVVLLNNVLFSKTFYFPIFENSAFQEDLINSSFEIIEKFNNIHAIATKIAYDKYVRVNHCYYTNDNLLITNFSKWHFIEQLNNIDENSIQNNLIGFFDDLNIYEQVELETNYIRKLKIEEILS
jgi:hypothetical protein